MPNTFQLEHLPTTQEILEVFTDEITSLGGRVLDVVDVDQQLFARAVLPVEADVRPSDSVAAGIAVRATAAEIVVHPYTVRRVCSNGAIAAQALESRRVERIQSVEVFRPEYEVAVILRDLRDAIRGCGTTEAFAKVTEELRSTVDVDADVMLRLLPSLARLPRHVVASIMPDILRRYTAERDRSVFGLLNAVTSAARDTRDPDIRWRLEETGGSLPARLPRAPRATRAAPALIGET